MTTESMHCRRCGKDTPPLNKAPFRNELGDRVLAEICPSCWEDGLPQQTSRINHYGLDPRELKAREFLYEQIEHVLLPGGEGKEIDTSKQGTIDWAPPGS